MRRGLYDKLRGDAATQSLVTDTKAGDRSIATVGIHGNATSRSSESAVSSGVTARLRFLQETPQGRVPGGSEVHVQFGLMESCADDMVIGCPQLLEWAVNLGRDLNEADFVPKIHFPELQVRPAVVKFYSNPQLVAVGHEYQPGMDGVKL